jgi:hypothetical protein
MKNAHLRILLLCIVVLLLSQDVIAFVSSSTAWINDAPTGTALGIGNIFDGIGRFFSSDNNENRDRNADDDGYLGSTRLVSLEVESIKPGGLRLFLMLFLLGMQNNPEKGTWRIDQPTSDEYVVDLYFHDQTGAMMVRLAEDKVTIDRLGSTPSTAYIMQEAVVVDGILEEMQKMATDCDIKRDDRLILLRDDSEITSARESLSFG